MNKAVLRTRHYPDVDFARCDACIDDLFGALRQAEASIAAAVRPLPPMRPRLLSSVYGDIDELAIAMPEDAFRQEYLVDRYMAILAAFSTVGRIDLLVPRSRAAEAAVLLARRGLDGRCLVLPMTGPDGRARNAYMPWTQDPFLVAEDADGASGAVRFIEPPRMIPAALPDDTYIADVLALHRPGADTQEVEAIFQGGNTLVARDRIFVGGDEVRNNLEAYGQDWTGEDGDPVAMTLQYLGQALERDRPIELVQARRLPPTGSRAVVRRGGREWDEHLIGRRLDDSLQPLFHIDVFMCLAGADRDGREIVLVGDPESAARTAGLERPAGFAELCASLDEVAASIARLGYVVRRNPLPAIYLEDDRGGDPRLRPYRRWYLATANNLQVQHGGSANIVWLPSYGYGAWMELAATDEINRQIWRDLGFEVRDVGDFHAFASFHGALHCMSKVLRRSPVAGLTPS